MSSTRSQKNNGSGRLTHTLKFKLMLLLAVLVVPLIIILYLNNFYSIKLADEQMNSYTTRILENYTTGLDTKMSNVSEYCCACVSVMPKASTCPTAMTGTFTGRISMRSFRRLLDFMTW